MGAVAYLAGLAIGDGDAAAGEGLEAAGGVTTTVATILRLGGSFAGKCDAPSACG
jgi:hypothetical protein